MFRPIQILFVLSIGSWFSGAGIQEASANPLSGAPGDTVLIADFGLEGQIPSAIDLVGPEDGPAGRNRAALSHRVQCWIDGIERCSFADRNDPRVRAIRQFLGFGPDDRDGSVVVHFPDQTRVQVRLVRALDAASERWTDSVYAPVVLPETAQGPDLASVPHHPGHFEGFAYEGRSEIREALDRLKSRLDMQVQPAFAVPVGMLAHD